MIRSYVSQKKKDYSIYSSVLQQKQQKKFNNQTLGSKKRTSYLKTHFLICTKIRRYTEETKL